MFYEREDSTQESFWKIEAKEDLNFPLHLHDNFEWVVVTEGELLIEVDKKQYSLRAGDSLLIFPDQIHRFVTLCHSKHVLCVFSPHLVRAYMMQVQSKIPDSNRYSPYPFFVDSLIDFSKNRPTDIALKGLLYSVCADFDRNCVYADRVRGKDGLLSEIFHFVKEQYSKNCSLEQLARHTGYHYVYLSRYFKQHTGISYTEYVNQYRISEAGYRLRNSAKTVLEIAYECGFDSLRSFNRNFQKRIGMCPSAYRDDQR